MLHESCTYRCVPGPSHPVYALPEGVPHHPRANDGRQDPFLRRIRHTPHIQSDVASSNACGIVFEIWNRKIRIRNASKPGDRRRTLAYRSAVKETGTACRRRCRRARSRSGHSTRASSVQTSLRMSACAPPYSQRRAVIFTGRYRRRTAYASSAVLADHVTAGYSRSTAASAYIRTD